MLTGFVTDTLGSLGCAVVAVDVARGVVEDLVAGALAAAFFFGAIRCDDGITGLVEKWSVRRLRMFLWLRGGLYSYNVARLRQCCCCFPNAYNCSVDRMWLGHIAA